MKVKSGDSAMEMLFNLWYLIGYVSLFAYLPLQIYAVMRCRGVWRIASLMPILLIVPFFALLDLVFAKEQGSNLIGLVELLIAGPVFTGFLVILLVIRRMVIHPRGDGSVPKTAPDGARPLDGE